MKRTLVHSIAILLLSISLHSFLLVSKAGAQPETAVSFQVFYDDLSPYGQWISDDQYGYAWVPDVEDDFRPYATNGYWIMTEFGNTWVSGFAWGWAPFHYGRWLYDSYYGWMWIPGYEWGPAWVCWRHGGGYYGWAPLGPWFIMGTTFSSYNCPMNWWVFIPQRQIHHRHPHRRPYHTTIINNTTIIVNTQVHNHTTYVTGPRVEEVHSATGNNVQIYNIEDVKAAGPVNIQGNRVQMYRPSISRQEAAPNQVRPVNAIKGPRSIGTPGPIRSNEQRTPTFRNETRPQTKPQGSPVRRTETPVERKPVTPRPQTQPKQPTRPVTRPVRSEEKKPVIQRTPTPVQQKPVHKAEPRTAPQPQRQPVRR